MSLKYQDTVGSKIGHWTVIGMRQDSHVLCRCACGTEKMVRRGNLKQGKSLSCGCARAEGRTIDPRRKSPEYAVWANMIQRCTNQKNNSFERYGGRGIGVCERWKSYENFYADMAPRPDGMTLDRIDNEGGYTPENCRWASHEEQCRNKSTNRWIEWNGRKQCMHDWCLEVGVCESSLIYRKRRLGSFSKAVGYYMEKRNAA